MSAYPTSTVVRNLDLEQWMDHLESGRITEADVAQAALHGHALDLAEKVIDRATRTVAVVKPAALRVPRRLSVAWRFAYRASLREVVGSEGWRVMRKVLRHVREQDAARESREPKGWEGLERDVAAWPALPEVRPVTRAVARIDLSKFATA